MLDVLGDKPIDVLCRHQHRPGQIGGGRQGAATRRIIGIAEAVARIDRIFPGVEQREIGATFTMRAMSVNVGGKGTSLSIRANYTIGQNEMELHPALVQMQHPATEMLFIWQACIDLLLETIHDFLHGGIWNAGLGKRQHAGGVLVGVRQTLIQLPHEFRIATQHPGWHAAPDAFPGFRVSHLNRQDIFHAAALGAMPEEFKEHEATPAIPVRWRAMWLAPPTTQPDWHASPRYSMPWRSG